MLMKIALYPSGSDLAVFPLCKGTSLPPRQESGSLPSRAILVVMALMCLIIGPAPALMTSGSNPSGPGAFPRFTARILPVSWWMVGTACTSTISAGIPNEDGIGLFKESRDIGTPLQPPSANWASRWASQIFCCSTMLNRLSLLVLEERQEPSLA